MYDASYHAELIVQDAAPQAGQVGLLVLVVLAEAAPVMVAYVAELVEAELALVFALVHGVALAVQDAVRLLVVLDMADLAMVLALVQ